ncbi:protein kinase [Streptomyces sp. NPDC001651]|jgi:serine/threonine protein kinase|uniref:serine/threonine-protein kinase n=1 Tax=Streptomyces sp. NPDC001651 TaxID=3364596 RepID=UPI0036B32040
MGTEGANFRVIAGRYRLEAKVGRGGMGVVWQATDQLLGRRVAVKEIPVDETLTASEARRQRALWLREAQAVAQLRHPHVIVVHDVIEEHERPYIVMELIDGESLADRLAAQGPLDVRETARVGADLLDALRAAHAAGVVHRDITPANVLVESGTERVVLTDFGIARVPGTGTLTESGSFVGSPEYTAPERMAGARTGPASDLWSVGALLCALLSGESPFRRDSLSGTVLAVVSDDVRPPAQATPILPVVQGLLERDPADRLDAAEAERMLREFLVTGEDLVPKRFSRRVERPWTTHKVAAAVVLAAVAAVAGASAAVLLADGGGGGHDVPTSSASPPVGTAGTVPPTAGPTASGGSPSPASPSGDAPPSGDALPSGDAPPSGGALPSGDAPPSGTNRR